MICSSDVWQNGIVSKRKIADSGTTQQKLTAEFIKKGDYESLNNENQWAIPTFLRFDGTNLLPFPVNTLLFILREMMQTITTSTDVAIAGTAILSVTSYYFSGVYRMSAKREHTELLVLDTLTVAEPSYKKSPVISMVKRPYIQFAHN